MIRPVEFKDSEQLCDIYNHYVLTTPVTFEEQAVTTDEMLQRVQETVGSLPWLVWEQDGTVLGYSHASKWKGRCAYRYSVESTVYLRPDAGGRGIGSRLYAAVIDRLRKQQFHTVVGGIALPNSASVALHEKFGFEKIAHFKEVGLKFGQWIDVGYWQLLLSDHAKKSADSQPD